MDEKRRLPSWMLGTSIANKVTSKKPIDLDENNDLTNEEVSVVTESTKPKAKRVTRKNTNDEKSFLVKCETKRKKKEFVEKDVAESRDLDQQEVVVEKRKRVRVSRIVEERKPLRKDKEKDCELDSSYEDQDLSCDEEDDDLTMEDVLSIAKEFVENDKSNTSQQTTPEEHYESKTKSSYTSSFVTETSHFVPQEETISHHDSIENTRSKVTLSDSIMTDDPTQDMLDLFLGPLLKKPISKESSRSIKDTIIPQDVKNRQRDPVISNKPVITTKKKSSLRDAVALLLD